jgi:5-methyltetrahydropteroyltriglutamate--homocysteine methyltransferase
MRMSSDGILVTHVGSLPRGDRLNDLLIGAESGEEVGARALEAEIESRVGEVIRRQLAAGVDIINDGEQGRVGFQTYVAQRMSGYGGVSDRRRPREHTDFPQYAAMLAGRFPRLGKQFNAPQAQQEVKYRDLSSIRAEIDRLKRQAAAADKPLSDCFMTAPSPGIVSTTLLNAYYPSREAYLTVLARELAHEYRAIHEAGLILQIDAPDLAMDRHIMFQDLTEEEFIETCEAHVAAINLGLTGIPPDRVRLHCCWGNWDGPHTHDIPLAAILPVLAEARVGALSIEFANPRHQHEYDALRRARLPDRLLVLPGVIETTSNIVEHPEVVARRIEEAVAAVGDRERVIASTDCGFGSFAGREWVAEDVVWAKLAAARAGADIATRRLWGRR